MGKNGFTKIELLIAISVLSFLAVAAIAGYFYTIPKTQVSDATNLIVAKQVDLIRSMDQGLCTSDGKEQTVKGKYGTLTITGSPIAKTNDYCPSGCKLTYKFNIDGVSKQISGKTIAVDVLQNKKLSGATSTIPEKFNPFAGRMSSIVAESCSDMPLTQPSITQGNVTGVEQADTEPTTPPVGGATPPAETTPPAEGTPPPGVDAGTGQGTPTEVSPTINPPHVSGFVRILNGSPASPSFEMLEVRTQPVSIFDRPTYWINSNDDLGCVIGSSSVTNTFQKSGNTMVVRMGTWQGRNFYGYYGSLDKNNTRYFIPMSDGRVLANISKILVDKNWSTNGKLRFASDSSIQVMFGYENKANYDSGIGGVIPIPFTGCEASIYKK